MRRTANVPGRIRFLIVSMITMNGISIVGIYIYIYIYVCVDFKRIPQDVLHQNFEVLITLNFTHTQNSVPN